MKDHQPASRWCPAFRLPDVGLKALERTTGSLKAGHQRPTLWNTSEEMSEDATESPAGWFAIGNRIRFAT
ncbi:MAG: hypothetical protein ACE5KM_22545, partial [Planctomycetaceae bacterium]